jgi:magnesium-transporting ATPase (P-type)
MVTDLFLITPLAFLMPLTPAYDKITYHRPVSSLFSFNIIFSMLLQTFCVGGFQIGGYFFMNYFFPSEDSTVFGENFCNNNKIKACGYNSKKKKFENNVTNLNLTISYYRECSSDLEKSTKNCIDNSVTFYISFAQYLILCVIFAKGKPFKKSFFHNIWFFCFSVIIFIYSIYIVIYIDHFVSETVFVIPFPDDSFFFGKPNKSKGALEYKYKMEFKYYVIIIILLNALVSLFLEKVVVQKAGKCWRKRRMNSLKKRIEDKDHEANLNMINTVKNYIQEKKIKKKKKDKNIIKE